MIQGYSLEPPMAEDEFLRRELRCSWTQMSDVDLSEILRRPGTHVVVCSDPKLYVSCFRQARPASVALIMISDEGYSRDRAELAEMPAIGEILRHYSTEPSSLREVGRAALGFIHDAGRGTPARRSIVPLLRSGLPVRARMKAWSRGAVSTLPLGYTSAFARAIAPSTTASLFAEAVESETVDTNPRSVRPVKISFRGNRGLAQRILGTEAVQRIPGARVAYVDAQWSGMEGGSSAREYVRELSTSRFALCPPGFINNESFRFYEALICGALPIEIHTAVTHLGRVAFRDGATIRTDSWQSALLVVDSMSEEERVDRVVRARALIDARMRVLRDRVAELVGSS